MTRSEKKKRRREKQRRQEANRKAKLEDAAHSTGSGQAGGTGAMNRAPTAQADRAPVETPAGDAATPSEASGQGPTEAELVAAVEDVQAGVNLARHKHAEGVRMDQEAREKSGLKPSRPVREPHGRPVREPQGPSTKLGTGRPVREPQGRRITDERALAMLERAAEFLDDVIEITRDVLAKVPPERRMEAAGIIRKSDFAKAPSDRVQPGTPQKRARRGADPVVTLMKLGTQASSLLNRILSKTNPDVAKLARRLRQGSGAQAA